MIDGASLKKEEKRSFFSILFLPHFHSRFDTVSIFLSFWCLHFLVYSGTCSFPTFPPFRVFLTGIVFKTSWKQRFFFFFGKEEDAEVDATTHYWILHRKEKRTGSCFRDKLCARFLFLLIASVLWKTPIKKNKASGELLSLFFFFFSLVPPSI